MSVLGQVGWPPGDGATGRVFLLPGETGRRDEASFAETPWWGLVELLRAFEPRLGLQKGPGSARWPGTAAVGHVP